MYKMHLRVVLWVPGLRVIVFYKGVISFCEELYCVLETLVPGKLGRVT